MLARERERKERTTLLMALLEDHLAKFHKMTDAKEIWDAIKSRFSGNVESKKMQKYILKQQFEGFSVSNLEGLHKGYDRSLPSSWSQVSLVTRTKPGMDNLSFDDLYNNLRVFESDVKGSTGSSSSAQNVAFVSSESTSNTNDVSIAYGISTSSGYNSQRENSSSYTDELMYSFFANQSSGPYLDHEDLEQLDEFDLEEMDLKWQVAMILMRLTKFHKKTGRRLQFDAKEPVGFDKTKVECYNFHNTGHFARECKSKGNQDSRRRDAGNIGYKVKDNYRRPRKQEEPKALVTLDGECVDWIGHAEDEQENFALMAYSNSGSDTEVEAQLVTHQKNQLWYEENIRFMKINLDDKTDVLTYHKKLLAEAVKEKEELKTKLENFQSSSKGLSKLLNSQMKTRDKSGLGYGDQVHNGVLSYENDVFQSVFDSRSSDVEDSLVHDRFANIAGMHVVPPPMTGNYMPSGPDREIDDSMFKYGPKQSKTSESDTQTSNYNSCESILYESNSDDEYVIQPSKVQEKPSFAFVNTIKHVKTSRETVKEQNTYSPSPKANKRDWNGLMSKRLGLGYGFTKKACFVCGNFSHLIRDCDFHEKRMAKQVELNKKKGKDTGQGENRSVWNNVQRLNHQNRFVLTAVLTRSGRIPVNTARQNLSSQTATTSTARKVNTARPIVNEIKPRNNFYKSHSPIRRPFNRTAAPKAKFSNQKVNIAKIKVVSAVGGKRDNPQRALKNKGIVDSGCSRHMTGNKTYLAEYQDYNVALLLLEMCDKKNKVLFTDTECALFKIKDGNLVESLRTLYDKIENQLNQKVKTIRCDNGTEFKNRDIIELYGSKGIKREYSNARTPQQNGVAERKNRTLIAGAARSMCHVTILNTIDHLGKFEGKSDEGFLVRYSLNSKAFRVYNLETKRVEENLHINFLENKPNVAGKGPNWLFDLDYLTDSMNYQPVRSENQANKTAGPEEANHSAGTQDNIDAGNSEMEADPAQDYFVLPIYSSYTSTDKSSEAKNEGEKHTKDIGLKTNEELVDQEDQAFLEELKRLKRQEKEANDAAEVLRKNTPLSTANPSNVFSTGGPSYPNLTNYADQDDSQIPALEDIYGNSNDGIFTNASYDDEGAVADFTNLESTMNVSPIPTSRIHYIHHTTQIVGDLKSAVQTRSKVNKSSGAHAFINLPYGKKAIGTKWVYRNKQDERSVVVRNKARIEAIRIFLAFASYMGFIVYQMDVKSAFLYGTINEKVYVSQPLGFIDPKFPKKVYKVVKALYGLHQAPRAWYATLSTFLLKSGYKRGIIDKTLFVKKDKNDIMLVQVYVDDIIFGFTKRSWCDEFEALMKSRFQMSFIGELTFFLGLQLKTANTLIKTQKPLTKDEEAADVDVHLYKSMIGSLMYLTASRPDIMFVVCACSRFQVTPKTSHLNAVKRIFRYLKGKPKLGLWYPRVSSFDLKAYSNSDYAGANLDRKSITGGCQFLGRRLISWQCKKQTIMATSTTKA
ncbi:putative ribonuclease H-like domain-containing protein [Tanacetum coccineum]|uniref:Ribonuclease H-like domain-containing protein n=1 Tax=Tanacetum coccineum TaxID=301880 RepID=A0ABQ5EXU4_9ASTR